MQGNEPEDLNLEQAIMACWGTKEDLQLLYENMAEAGENEDLVNAALGLVQIHEMRCKKLFSLFEEMIENGQI